MLVDVSFEVKYFENMAKKNPNIAQEFNRIITTAQNTDITSPEHFYKSAIQPFIRNRRLGSL